MFFIPTIFHRWLIEGDYWKKFTGFQKEMLLFPCGQNPLESKAKEEIENANFYLEREYFGTLIHDDEDTEKGKVLNFRKKV